MHPRWSGGRRVWPLLYNCLRKAFLPREGQHLFGKPYCPYELNWFRGEIPLDGKAVSLGWNWMYLYASCRPEQELIKLYKVYKSKLSLRVWITFHNRVWMWIPDGSHGCKVGYTRDVTGALHGCSKVCSHQTCLLPTRRWHQWKCLLRTNPLSCSVLVLAVLHRSAVHSAGL